MFENDTLLSDNVTVVKFNKFHKRELLMRKYP